MAVAQAKYFTAQNLERCAFNAPSLLAEQAVHCLELVAELVEAGLNFQFKGGNSLLLILEEPKRFSIDVDIATDRPKEEIECILDSIVSQYNVFRRWERRQHKTKPWIPLSSYYLYYKSIYDDSQDSSVMLDVQMQRSPYETELKDICCTDLFRCGVKCEVPLPSSIISDKLLTLGPNTLGIPVCKGKEAQRLKHVYDVSRLLILIPNVNLMRESFENCLRQENQLQSSTFSVMEIITDTLSYCWSVALHESQPLSYNSVILGENIQGLIPFRNHLFESDYSWLNLRKDMARVALCISAIGNRSVGNSMLKESLSFADVERKSGGSNNIDDIEISRYWQTIYSWWENEIFWT